ncbi:hypothetical protein EVAR_14120_1 [Eumeta japonica]|uniref:Uncharacterized protein n=1 Tax=Eumeta variegata TaxID=151549 RepID=A0A4C1UN94_EUMVA|nr:hypothetical protein EVAR_14120_1 [Eumeta japonica]
MKNSIDEPFESALVVANVRGRHLRRDALIKTIRRILQADTGRIELLITPNGSASLIHLLAFILVGISGLPARKREAVPVSDPNSDMKNNGPARARGRPA